MQIETSAGGVIIQKKNNRMFVLLLKDKGGQWTFPKGLVEKGEVLEKAAEREIAEEVGLHEVKLVSPLVPIEYFYTWEKTLRKKQVHYFLFEYLGNENPTPQTEEGIQEVKWVGLEEAKEIIGYKKTNEKVLKEVESALSS